MTQQVQQFLTIDEATNQLQKLNLRRDHVTIGGLRLTTQYDTERDGLALHAVAPEGNTLRVDDVPEAKLLRSLGLSRKFLESCKDNSDLAIAALDQARSGQKGDRLLIAKQGDRIIGVSPASKEDLLVSPMEVWDAIRSEPGVVGISDIVPIRNGTLDLRVITSEGLEPPRRVGDVTRLGVRIHVGSQVTLNPFLFRLVCLNGMQTMEEGAALDTDLGDPISSIRNNFAKVMGMSREFGGRFISTDETIVPNPHEYVMRSLRIAGAGNSLRTRVSDLLSTDAPNGTLYEILNIMTAIARQSADRPQTRNRIETIAGRVVELQAGSSRCRTCNSNV